MSTFVETFKDSDQQVVIVIGTRKSESSNRSAVIKKYENDIITLNRLESGSKSSVSKGKDKTERAISLRLDAYDEDDYLNGKYDPRNKAPENIQKLYKKLINIVSDTFEQVEFKQMKKYGGFYSTQDGSSICTFVTAKTKITLYYSTTRKDLISLSAFVVDASKGHYGLGDFGSIINDENDIKKALPVIEKIYSHKIS